MWGKRSDPEPADRLAGAWSSGPTHAELCAVEPRTLIFGPAGLGTRARSAPSTRGELFPGPTRPKRERECSPLSTRIQACPYSSSDE